MVGADPDAANTGKVSAWAKDYWTALHPYSAGGAYVNVMMDEGEAGVRVTDGKNYDRLTQIKKRYDAENLFRVNQNIRPANDGNRRGEESTERRWTGVTRSPAGRSAPTRSCPAWG